MKAALKLLVGLSALALPAAGQATVQINFTTTAPVPGSNDFQSQLSGLGLTRFTTNLATLILSSNSIITFEFLGSESGFNDTFTAGPVTYSEFTTLTNNFASPIALGSANFSAGSLLNLLNFTSSGGAPATVGQDGFGIFLGANQTSGQSFSTFYLGYDDQITNQDDNHDDMIIRATVRDAVPEPATWAMMLLGFAGIGMAFRRRQPARLRQSV